MEDSLTFEQMRKLAVEQPEELEQWRQEQIEKIISTAPASIQRRLRGLQFQIDCERQKHTSPMGACIAISKKMHESLRALRTAILDKDALRSVENNAPTNARIIDFPKRA